MTMLYTFLTGIGLAISLFVCLAGCCFRLWQYVKHCKNKKMQPETKIQRGCLKRIFIPATLRNGWPIGVLVNYFIALFVLFALLAVVFNVGHAEMIRGLTGLNWPSLSALSADVLTFLAIFGGLGVLLRHLLIPELRNVTNAKEYALMALLVVPFFSGLMARTGLGGYQFWLTLHLVLGHCFLWLAPFCKFSRLVAPSLSVPLPQAANSASQRTHASLLPFLLFGLCALPGTAFGQALSEPGQPASRLILQSPAAQEKGQMPTIGFDHTKHATWAMATSGPNSGDNATCGLCHLVLSPEKAPAYGFFKNTGTATTASERKAAFHTACVSCHIQQGALPTGPAVAQCRTCHTVSTVVPSVVSSAEKLFIPNFDNALHARHINTPDFMAAAAFGKETEPPATSPLSTVSLSQNALLNKDATCAACHHPRKSDPLGGPTLDSCRACHAAGPGTATNLEAQKYNPPALRTVAHETCLSCHVRTFDRGKPSGPILCEGCHSPASWNSYSKIPEAPPMTMNRPVGLLLTDKQGPDLKPLGPLYPTGPQWPTAMQPVPFKHNMHEKVVDCTSCHHSTVKQTCVSCHTPYGNEKAAQVTLAQAMHSVTAKNSCVSCHEQQKLSRLECAGCHTPQPAEKQGTNCGFCHKGSLSTVTETGSLLIPLDTPKNTQNIAQDNMRESVLEGQSSAQAPAPLSVVLPPESVIIAQLSNEYQPVKFPHAEHMKKLLNGIGRSAPSLLAMHEQAACQSCHHNSPASATPPLCVTCHPKTLPVGVVLPDDRPLLKAAYHQKCMGCHTLMQTTKPLATECVQCHALRQPGESVFVPR